MSTQRRKGLRSAGPEKRPAIDKISSRRFPVQHEIQKLEGELNAFNERIAELEDEGHHGHAMKVLKANALDLARRIDELRSLLVEPKKKDRTP
jgi:predicted nuclease with TOPRIM domain